MKLQTPLSLLAALSVGAVLRISAAPDATSVSQHEVIRRVTASTVIDWSAADYTRLQSKPGQPAHTEDGIRFSDGWTRWTGQGPRKDRLHFASQSGATATWEANGGQVTLIHKIGPDCGIAFALIDGEPAPQAHLDSYSPTVEWNRRIVIATNLPAGRHIVTLVTLGTKHDKSSNTHVQIVDIENLNSLKP